ncbi:hypothetical protein GEMRC1_004993 [Eukaryota sp. GEM-RC1]
MATSQSKRIIPGPIELDLAEKALLCKYELEVTELDSNLKPLNIHLKPSVKSIKLEHLISSDTDCEELATQIVSRLAKIVSRTKIPEVSSHISNLKTYLFPPPSHSRKSSSVQSSHSDTSRTTDDPPQTQRHSANVSSLSIPSSSSHTSDKSSPKTPFPFINILSLPVSAQELEVYLHKLYDSPLDMEEGTGLIAALALRVKHLPLIVESPALLSALSNTFQTEGKKSLTLSFNIILCFSSLCVFKDFYKILFEYKVDSMVLKLVKWELKRYKQFMKDLKKRKGPEEQSKVEETLLQVKNQRRLLNCCLFLILNILNNNIDYATKLKRKDFVFDLITLLKINDSVLNWLSCLILFHFSVRPNVSEFIPNSAELIDILINQILGSWPKVPLELRQITFKLLQNLLKFEQFRHAAMECGTFPLLVKILSDLIDKMMSSSSVDKNTLNDFNSITRILYLISIDSEFRRLLDQNDSFNILLT